MVENLRKKNHITKKEALEFKKRWETVNKAEKQELRETSAFKKMQQLAALMSSIKAFVGWDDILALEENKVRERWNRLKEVYSVSK